MNERFTVEMNMLCRRPTPSKSVYPRSMALKAKWRQRSVGVPALFLFVTYTTWIIRVSGSLLLFNSERVRTRRRNTAFLHRRRRDLCAAVGRINAVSSPLEIRGGGSDGLVGTQLSTTAVVEEGVATDHRPARGKMLTSPLNREELKEAYREIQRDYELKAFGAKSDWKVLNQHDGVQVSILQHPSDPTCPYVRMRAMIPVPVADCWNFLCVSEWDRTMPKMDPFYEGVSIYGDFEFEKERIHMILCRKRLKRILAFGKRDLVFLSVTQEEPLADGSWASGTVSVHTAEIPRQPGYTRAFQDSIAFYKPVKNNSATDLTIVCRIDLNDSGENGVGGFIPMWLYVKTIGLTGTKSVIRMREALLQEQREDVKRINMSTLPSVL